MTKVKIVFNQAYSVKDGSGTSFKEGQVVQLEEASANHFISRGVAEVATSKASKPEAKPEAKKNDD